MSATQRDAKKQATASGRRRHSAPERLAREQRQAPQAAEALHQALAAGGLPETGVAETAGRFRSRHTRRGTMVGRMVPALFGGRTPSARWRVRGWDKHGPSRFRTLAG